MSNIAIAQTLASITGGKTSRANRDKDSLNQTLRSAVENQPLFQLLSLNQKTNNLINNKTSFLTSSAKCLSQKNCEQHVSTLKNIPPQYYNNGLEGQRMYEDHTNQRAKLGLPTSPVEFANSIWSSNQCEMNNYVDPSKKIYENYEQEQRLYRQDDMVNCQRWGPLSYGCNIDQDSNYLRVGCIIDQNSQDPNFLNINSFNRHSHSISSNSSVNTSIQDSIFDIGSRRADSEPNFGSTTASFYSPVNSVFEFNSQQYNTGDQFKIPEQHMPSQPLLSNYSNPEISFTNYESKFSLPPGARTFIIHISNTNDFQQTFTSNIWFCSCPAVCETYRAGFPVYLLFKISNLLRFNALAAIRNECTASSFWPNRSIAFTVNFVFTNDIDLNHLLAPNQSELIPINILPHESQVPFVTALAVVDIFQSVKNHSNLLP